MFLLMRITCAFHWQVSCLCFSACCCLVLDFRSLVLMNLAGLYVSIEAWLFMNSSILISFIYNSILTNSPFVSLKDSYYLPQFFQIILFQFNNNVVRIVYYLINMKSNPIMIIKHDQAKKRSGPIDLKRKIGSLPSDLPSQSYPNKIETKPRSTSKSQEKVSQFNFSKSFLISNRIQNRSTSNDRIKSSSNKGRASKQSKEAPTSLIKIDKLQKASPNTSKIQHFHSTDRQTRRAKTNSKGKSYLIDYLNNRNHTTKAESLGKLEQIKRQQKAKSQTTRSLLKEIKYGFRTRQGVLITNPSKPNQDSYLINSSERDGVHLFAVADGHGTQGHCVSQLAIKRLGQYFQQKYRKTENHQVLFTQIYDNIQNELFQTKDFNSHTSGSTMITVLIQTSRRLTCANVGDSRAILARQIDKRNWEIIHLSQDHKPNLQKEKKRIIKRGGKVHSYRDENGHHIGPQRVWLPNQNLQGLAMSRSLGDNVSKPIGVTHQPELVHLEVEERDKFILLASDGVWQFIKNFEILQLVVPYYKQGKLEQCCDALLKLAYDRWTVEDSTVIDDITFVLIFLNQV